MKILAMNAFTEEVVELKKWAQENKQDLTITETPLTTENIDQVKGFDALSVQQVVPLGSPAVYAKLAEFGIKQIAVRSVGYEFIDLAAAKANGLVVTNVPVYSPRSVAEYVLAQTMRLLRHLNQFEENAIQHDFTWLGKISPELSELTIGIIGAGHIGSAVAQIFHALGSQIMINDPVENPDLAGFATYTDLTTLLTASDVVTLHVPLTSQTMKLLSTESFAKMKASAYLINAARGQVVDTPALIQALKSGTIAGAALDVWTGEGPYFDYDWQGKDLNNSELETLLTLPNLILTPHIAFFTKHSVHNIAYTALNEAVRGASGQPVKHPVN
ncbi:NAD(P)-dependent oxidoreductase [Agrilactobacillus fermenti]|uniref:NAD(P)-dependent oxidoreductase n=1 Tax=Agrilactobacillus fermenti TaxID=2586909 RepID=UPI003A5BCA7F